MFLRSILIAGLLVIASEAWAVDSQGRAEPKGWGVLTCAQFLAEADKKQEEIVIRAASWLNGYITAFNIYTPETYDLTPWQDPIYLLNLLGRNCQKSPDERFVKVVHAMANFLRPNRYTEWEEKVVAEAGERRLAVYKPVLKDVQQALADAGFLKGGVDGTYGPMTRAALEEYQKAQNIPVTGLPDSLTVERLLIIPKLRQEQESGQAPGGGQPQQ